MKILEQTPTKLILRKDRQFGLTLFSGIVFAILELLFVLLMVFNIVGGADPVFVGVVLILGLGFQLLFIVGAGFEEEKTYSFDKIIGCMTLKRRSIFETKVNHLSLDRISKVVVTEHTTNSSVRVSKYSTWHYSSISYKISLVIKSGKRILLSEGTFLDANTSSYLAECIAEFLQVPLNTPF